LKQRPEYVSAATKEACRSKCEDPSCDAFQWNPEAEAPKKKCRIYFGKKDITVKAAASGESSPGSTCTIKN